MLTMGKNKRLTGVGIIILIALLLWPVRNWVNDVLAGPGVIKANLQLSRTLTDEQGKDISGTQIKRSSPFAVNYTILPLPVGNITQPASEESFIASITLTEKLPAQIEIDRASLPAEFKVTGNLTEGYTLQAQLGDVRYVWNAANQALVPDIASNSKLNAAGTFAYSIKAQAAVTGPYTFANAVLAFDDLHERTVPTPAPTPTPVPTAGPGDSGSGSPLGTAGDYTVFLFGDGTMRSGAINGSFAVGGNLNLSSGATINQGHVSVEKNGDISSGSITDGGLFIKGNLLFNSNGGTVNGRMAVGGDLDYRGNAAGVTSGNRITYGGKVTYNMPDYNPAKAHTSQSSEPVPGIPDFAKLQAFWLDRSKQLTQPSANGSKVYLQNWGTLELEATDLSLNHYVFNVSEELLAKAAGLNINIPPTASAVINFAGKDIQWKQWVTFKSGAKDKIIYNYYDAGSLRLNSLDGGLILAPQAKVTASGGFNGILIAHSLMNEGGYSFNKGGGFTGPIPEGPKPTPSATSIPVPTPAPPVRVSQGFGEASFEAIEPPDNTPRTLEISGGDSTQLNQPLDLAALYTGPATEKGIKYTWSVDDKTGASFDPEDGSVTSFTPSKPGDYTVTVTVTSDSNPEGITATKVISVRELRIDGKNNVFLTKTIELKLISANLPPNADIQWRLAGDGSNYATLIQDMNDSTKHTYKLTGNALKDGIIVEVSVAGVTALHTVNVIPIELTAIQGPAYTVEMFVGEQLDLNTKIRLSPDDLLLNDFKDRLDWVSNRLDIAAFDPDPVSPERNGWITGISPGVTTVVVSYRENPLIQTVIHIKVRALPNGDRY